MGNPVCYMQAQECCSKDEVLIFETFLVTNHGRGFDPTRHKASRRHACEKQKGHCGMKKQSREEAVRDCTFVCLCKRR